MIFTSSFIPFTPPTSVWSLSLGFDPSSPGVRKELFLCGPALQTWTSDSGWSLGILLCLGKQELASSLEELSVTLKREQCFWTHKQGALWWEGFHKQETSDTVWVLSHLTYQRKALGTKNAIKIYGFPPNRFFFLSIINCSQERTTCTSKLPFLSRETELLWLHLPNLKTCRNRAHKAGIVETLTLRTD